MDTFTTDATGTVTLPESLVPGTYYVSLFLIVRRDP